MRRTTPIFFFAPLLIALALSTYAHGTLLVTEEVLVDYVEYRLGQLEVKEKLKEDEAIELRFIRENRHNLESLADFYGMRLKEKIAPGIPAQEKPAAGEIQEKSTREISRSHPMTLDILEWQRERGPIEPIPTKTPEQERKVDAFSPDEEMGEVQREEKVEERIAMKDLTADESAAPPAETSFLPIKPETTITPQEPAPQSRRLTSTGDLMHTTALSEINATSPPHEMNQTNEIDQTSQIAPPSPIITEEDVRQFLKRYKEQYIRKDIYGFLSLFSYRAVQNGREGFNEIGRIYSDFFDSSRELRYHLDGMRIEIYQEVLIAGLFYQRAALAEARYQVDQVSKNNGKTKTWKGDVRWILVKENGALKILHLDFKPGKSP